MTPARVLVVDDDDSIRWMLRTMLEAVGCVVVEAENVHDALSLVQDPPAPFRLIVTDFNLPDGDGVGLIRAVVGLPGREPPTMILFTGMNLDQTFEIRSLRAEVQGRYPVYFAAKGNAPSELERLFEHVLAARPA